jgi:hypothetical protein
MEPAITRADFARLLGHVRQWAYTRRSLPPLTRRGSKRVILLVDAHNWLAEEIAAHEAKIVRFKTARAALRADSAIRHLFHAPEAA